MDSIINAGGSAVNKRSSSIFGPSDGDLARPPIITTDLGNGIFSFTAGIGNLTINNNSSPARATKQRNTKTTPFSSPKRQGGQPSAELPKIGAISVLQQSTENDLGTAHWTSILADPTIAIQIKVPYSEFLLGDLLVRVFNGNNYPPDFDNSAISHLTLDDSLEGQKGRHLLLRFLRLLDKEHYDQTVQDHIIESIY